MLLTNFSLHVVDILKLCLLVHLFQGAAFQSQGRKVIADVLELFGGNLAGNSQATDDTLVFLGQIGLL